MTTPAPPRPAVTVAIVPRERFSHTLRTIASLYAETAPPFEVIVVDGKPPAPLRAALEAEAETRGFRLIRCPAFVSPNQARNLAVAAATTPYIVFADNDLVFTPGWLDALLACAEATGAEAVGPVYLFDGPEKGQVHMAGGRFLWSEEGGERLMDEVHLHSGRPLGEVRPLLARGPCDFLEFHCMLVRRAVFERLGPLDEELLSTSEHLDFALALAQAGGRSVLEPDAVVGYMAHAGYTLADLDYFRLRWSDAWNRRSLDRLREKWGFSARSPFFETHLSWLAGHQVYVGLPQPPAAAAWDGGGVRYAQTNLQLYRQLESLGWSGAELRAMAEAYTLAARLFGTLLRPSGKPFLAHVVGTASILAAHGAAPLAVTAGLLHAAYTHGRFEGLPEGPTAEKRAALRGILGAPAERIIAAYTAFDWSPENARRILPAVAAMPVDTGNLIALRLANTLEDYLDDGMAHGAKPDEAAGWLPAFEAVAAHLGLDALAGELERAVEDAAARPMPSAARHAMAGSVEVAPLRLADRRRLA